MRRFRNPLDFPAQLILDPSMPIPARMPLKHRKRLAELREAYQWSVQRQFDRMQLKDPESAGRALVPLMAPLQVEHLCIVPLDPKSRCIGMPVMVTRGDVDGVDAGPRAVFRCALQAGATSVLVAHNHPSGTVEPSAADIEVTRRLSAAGRTVDIQLVDHLIIAPPNMVTSIRQTRPDAWR